MDCRVVYLRSLDTAGGVHTSLIVAKRRVATLKKIFLPNLGLCGAHLLSQLMKQLQEILALPTCNFHIFTDSTIVLDLIHGSSQRFKTLEANQIGEIQEHVQPEKWKHVDGKENPAELGSRGILPAEIINHKLWWNVPEWLKEDPASLPSKFISPPKIESLSSLGIQRDVLKLKERKEFTLQAVTSKPEPVIDILKFSSYSHLIRVTAWVFRVSTRSNLFTHTPLTVSELSKAKVWLSKQAQVQMFQKTMKTLKKGEPLLLSNPLRPLNPFHDIESWWTSFAVTERLPISASNHPPWKAPSHITDYRE